MLQKVSRSLPKSTRSPSPPLSLFAFLLLNIAACRRLASPPSCPPPAAPPAGLPPFGSLLELRPTALAFDWPRHPGASRARRRALRLAPSYPLGSRGGQRRRTSRSVDLPDGHRRRAAEPPRLPAGRRVPADRHAPQRSSSARASGPRRAACAAAPAELFVGQPQRRTEEDPSDRAARREARRARPCARPVATLSRSFRGPMLLELEALVALRCHPYLASPPPAGAQPQCSASAPHRATPAFIFS